MALYIVIDEVDERTTGYKKKSEISSQSWYFAQTQMDAIISNSP